MNKIVNAACKVLILCAVGRGAYEFGKDGRKAIEKKFAQKEDNANVNEESK